MDKKRLDEESLDLGHGLTLDLVCSGLVLIFEDEEHVESAAHIEGSGGGHEAEIDEVLAEFSGDPRAAIRALLQDMATLQLVANQSSSRGFLRGSASAARR